METNTIITITTTNSNSNSNSTNKLNALKAKLLQKQDEMNSEWLSLLSSHHNTPPASSPASPPASASQSGSHASHKTPLHELSGLVHETQATNTATSNGTMFLSDDTPTGKQALMNPREREFGFMLTDVRGWDDFEKRVEEGEAEERALERAVGGMDVGK